MEGPELGKGLCLLYHCPASGIMLSKHVSVFPKPAKFLPISPYLLRFHLMLPFDFSPKTTLLSDHRVLSYSEVRTRDRLPRTTKNLKEL